uniref:Translocon-associated protein subunit beta n=1 Tax=Steinernema glaseri TaxID=37863 RepID=A0A1I7YIT7_9BILA
MKLLVLFFALAGIAFAEDGASEAAAPLDSAHLLASKSSLSQYAVEGMDFVLEYHLHNVGDRAALRVTLDDRHSFPTQAFEIVKGTLQVRWEKIAPGAEVTHAVTVKPRTFGGYNNTAAVITYYPSDEAKEVRVGYTSASGEGYIFRLKDYERRFSPKSYVWLISALMCLPPFAFIYYAWSSKANLYKDPVVSKKSK